MDLTDTQWAILQPWLSAKPTRKQGRPWQEARAVLNGILWVLRTGAPWHDLPDRYPPYQTCHRRLQQWQRDGTLTRRLHALAEDRRARGQLDLSETFLDASFSSAKQGALLSAPLAEEKAVKSWRSPTAMGFPIACGVASASPQETKLVESTLEHRFLDAWPERLIGDAAYDSDPLDRELWREHRMRRIAPHRPHRRNQTPDGRAWRRYCRRWKIERLFAWRHNFRRLVTRGEFYEANFLGMLPLGCLIILLRNL